jgi:dTDP-glucose 4,6-dehydratase
VLAVLEGGRIGEVYNIGGLDIVENLTLARGLLRLLGQPETLLSYVKDRPGHDRRYALSCEKMERALGWKPSIPLDEGLSQTIEWYKVNHDWVGKIRAGEYRSYYEKYYENRDSSLDAVAPSGPKSPR